MSLSFPNTAINIATDTPLPAVVVPMSAEAELSTAQLRVLHLVNGEHFSGAERVQSHLGRCLPSNQVIADFACVKPGRFADMLDQHQQDESLPSWGICHRLPMRGKMDLSVASRLAKLVKQDNYDLLHAHTPRTAMIAAVASRFTGVPWIYHVHSPASRDCDSAFSNRVNSWIEKQSLRNCAHLICVSGSLRDDLIAQGHDPRRVTIVHNGVPAVCPPRSRTPEIGQTWTIGMVALMRARKGLEVVLQALARLKSDNLVVHLRCIGPFETDEYESHIRQQVEALEIGNQIEWFGFCDDVPSQLARLDAMVLPSLFGEGLPMVVLEAMAAGLPTIATRVEGTPEAIRHGQEGLLAEPRDAESLAAQIRDLITGVHDWRELSANAKSRHAALFSDHAMARATADVYHAVLAH